MRTIQEEQLRQLRLVNAQLNPGPALLKFSLGLSGFLFIVFSLFGLMVQLARPAAMQGNASQHNIQRPTHKSVMQKVQK